MKKQTTTFRRVHVVLDEQSEAALAAIGAVLSATGKNADRSTCIRYAAIRCARSLSDGAA